MKLGSRAELAGLLAKVPTVDVEGVYARCIPQLDFGKGVPPRFLRTSGRPNRLNPRDVECLYLSDSETTAKVEWDHAWSGVPGGLQPKLTIFARIRVGKVIDLRDSAVVTTLHLNDDDLYGSWRLAPVPTRLQAIGAHLATRKTAAAVLYPSAAGKALGAPGSNIAVFLQRFFQPTGWR